MENKVIDVPAESEPSQALTVRDAVQAVERAAAPEKPTKTAQEMRVLEVSEALLPAYQKMGTLELTDQECDALMAPFPDEIVECRPHDGLLFIPHIHVSDRLNKIFKPGKWALVRRREWFDADSSTMFGEYVLVIRGCFVGESVGGHPYAKNNPKINYSDVLESTAAEALRRICGKRLSCGSQVWNPEYCRQWESKHRGYANGKYFKKPASGAPPPVAPPQRIEHPRNQTKAPAPASQPAQPPASGEYPVVTILTITAIPKEKPTKNGGIRKYNAYKVMFSDGFGELVAWTFDDKIAELANELANTGEKGHLKTKPGNDPKFSNIVSLERASLASQAEMPMNFDEQGNPVDIMP